MRSNHESGFEADTAPMTTPTTTAKIMAALASWKVAGTRSHTMSSVGRLSQARASPRSPRSSLALKIQYCWMSGLSKP